jgi:hypothetical protein
VVKVEWDDTKTVAGVSLPNFVVIEDLLRIHEHGPGRNGSLSGKQNPATPEF